MTGYPTYLGTEICALYIGMTREKVRQEILQGELPAALSRGQRTRYRVEVEDLRRYLLRNQCTRALELLNARYPPPIAWADVSREPTEAR